MTEMDVSSHKRGYSSNLKLSHLHITWQLDVVIFSVRRVRFKMYTNIELTVMEFVFFKK